MELKLLYGPRPQRAVNHAHIVDMILRHVDDDNEAVAERFAEQQGLSTLDLLKLKAMLKQAEAQRAQDPRMFLRPKPLLPMRRFRPIRRRKGD